MAKCKKNCLSEDILINTNPEFILMGITGQTKHPKDGYGEKF